MDVSDEAALEARMAHRVPWLSLKSEMPSGCSPHHGRRQLKKCRTGWALLATGLSAPESSFELKIITGETPPLSGSGYPQSKGLSLPQPRQFKGEVSSPDALAIVSGGGAPVEKVYDLLQRVGSIEKPVAYLEAHADDSRKKPETISAGIVAAKATFRTLK